MCFQLCQEFATNFIREIGGNFETIFFSLSLKYVDGIPKSACPWRAIKVFFFHSFKKYKTKDFLLLP